ncbi:MAG: AsmA-like C-terminal domain-containing protein [Thermodesulfovibrionales bacterium]
MKKRKKIIYWSGVIIFVLITIILALSLSLPKFINTESVRSKIIESLSKTFNGKIYIKKVELSFFPRPCFKLHQVQISSQEKTEGKINLIKIYPAILPLFTGEVRISKVNAEYPDFLISVPERKEKLSLADIEKKLLSSIYFLKENAPGVDITIKKGSLNLDKNKKTNLLFQNINAQIGFPPWDLKYTITARLEDSDFAVSGRLDPKNFKGKGNIYLKNFGIHKVIGFFLTDDINYIKDSTVNLRVSFKTEGIGTLQADIEGSIPNIVPQRNNQRLNLKIDKTKASLEITKEKTLLTIDKLSIDKPHITLTGSLKINKMHPNIYLFLKGTDIDVNQLRNSALIIASDISIVSDVSKYVIGGRVPLISFYTKGVSLDDLGKTENIHIEGTMREGNIFVPGPDLAFKSVNGDCVITKGILNGSQIYAQLDNARLSEGVLKVGLKGENAPLHLDTLANINLAELLSLLKQIVKNDALLREFNLISEIKGHANGRVVLGETIDSIQVAFEVFDAKLHARYKRIPYPVELKEGRFFYDSSKIVTRNANFILGSSSFNRFNSTLKLNEPYSFEISSEKSFLDLEELYSWLSSYKQIKNLFDNITSLKGTTLIELMNIKGSFMNPEKWSFHIISALQNLKINFPFFPDTLTITDKRFEIMPQKISFSKALISIDNTTLSVSGFLKTDLKSIQKADISINGTAGSSVLEWLKKSLNLPKELKFPQPVFISDAHLVQEELGVLSFQSNMKIKDGPDVSVDLYKTPKELSIKKVSLNDKTSNARFSFNRQDKKIDLTFDGQLSGKTVDKLLNLSEISAGLIKGVFHAEIQSDKSLRINSSGKIYGEKIAIPWKSDNPIKIGKLYLNADLNGIKFNTDSLIWHDNSLSFDGSLISNEKGTIIKMDVLADRLDWNNLKRIFELDKKADDMQQIEWKQSIRIIASVKSKDFIFEKLSVSPMHADISLSGGVMDATISRANICYIPISGKIKTSQNNIETNFKITASNQPLEPFITCIGNKGLVTGKFDMNGEISSHSKKNALAKSINGKINFKAKDGRIYRYGTIAKIFALLNVTEIFRGKLPDVTQEGFAYQSMSFKGQIRDGKLFVQEGIIDGSSMEIVCEGNIDFVEKKIDMNLLVAPLKTVDFILRKIPIVRDITGRSLISIPVTVKGDIVNPDVNYLPLSSVGSGLLGIMERTIKLPVKIIQPFISNGDKNQ